MELGREGCISGGTTYDTRKGVPQGSVLHARPESHVPGSLPPASSALLLATQRAAPALQGVELVTGICLLSWSLSFPPFVSHNCSLYVHSADTGGGLKIQTRLPFLSSSSSPAEQRKQQAGLSHAFLLLHRVRKFPAPSWITTVDCLCHRGQDSVKVS